MSFHNELMFYLTIIPSFVLIFLIRVIISFRQGATEFNWGNITGTEHFKKTELDYKNDRILENYF